MLRLDSAHPLAPLETGMQTHTLLTIPTSVASKLLNAVRFTFVMQLFAVVPPCRCYGGWLTFGIALAFIGGLTAVIGDLATLMGK